jgi:hypothetical protein
MLKVGIEIFVLLRRTKVELNLLRFGGDASLDVYQ